MFLLIFPVLPTFGVEIEMSKKVLLEDHEDVHITVKAK